MVRAQIMEQTIRNVGPRLRREAWFAVVEKPQGLVDRATIDSRDLDA